MKNLTPEARNTALQTAAVLKNEAQSMRIQAEAIESVARGLEKIGDESFTPPPHNLTPATGG